MQEYIRHAAGSYEACGTLSSRTYEFPLVDVIHPDLRHHPLFAFATVVSVDVPEGAALVLPAYWYHQVESDAQSGSLNVAINYWFSSGSLPERLHGLMRKRLLVQNGCTGLSMYARR